MKKIFRSRRISMILALVLVLAMLGSLAGCGKVDPKAAVKTAAIATAADFARVGDQFGYDAISKLVASGNCHQEMEFYLQKANLGMDLSGFYGTGLTMTADSSIPDRKMAVDMGLRVADYTALNLNLLYVDSGIYFACPELLGSRLLGINTETLAQDLPEAGLDESFNFNIFDLIDGHLDENGKFSLSADTMKAMLDAYNTMADASAWAAGEKTSLTVGGVSGDCEVYTLTVPAEKACDCIMSILTALLSDDYCATIMQSLLAEELYDYDSYEQYIEEMLSELEGELREGLTQDLSFVFYVKDKLLRGVDTALTGDGETLNIELRFGMGKNAADCIDLRVYPEDEGELRLTSSGSHILADGKFTDKTVFTFDDGIDGETVSFTLDTDYDTKSGDYTSELYAEAEGDAVTLSAAGNLKIDGKTMDMSFDSIRLSAMGMDVTLAGSYHAGEGEAVKADISGAVMIPDLTDADYAELDAEMEENLNTLAMKLMSEVPAVQALLLGML